MQLKTILTQLESGTISADQAQEQIMGELEKVRTQLQSIHDKPPFTPCEEGMSEMRRRSEEHALIGWQGGVNMALLLIDNLMGKELTI